MEELLKGIEGIDRYNFTEPKKSLFLAMVINSLIIFRKIDYELISHLGDKINNYKEVNNYNKDSIYCDCMNTLIDYIYTINQNKSEEVIGKTIVDNYFINGYIFHAFNAGLYDEIGKNGLRVRDKLIDTELFKKVADIFMKRNALVFGLYKTGDDNSVFFAGALNNIYQYGAGSPSFFRKFIFQNDKLDSYLARDYDKCLESVLKTIEKYNLSDEEKSIVLAFFNKYYELFASNDYYVALYKRERKVETNYTREDIKRLFKEELSHNYRVYNNIDASELILVNSNIYKNRPKKK